MPLVSDEVHLKVQVPVAQEWLAGKVPQTVVMTNGQALPITIPITGSTGASGSGTAPTGSK